MDNKQLPVIDWELATKLAGNNREAAEEFLDLILKHLEADLSEIKKHYSDKEYNELRQSLHKLHGAISYSGLPRLKSLLKQLESNLKSDIVKNLPEKMQELDREIEAIRTHR